MTNNTQTQKNKSPERKLGYWTAVLDHRIHHTRRELFSDENLGRREWRLLATLTDGPQTIDELREAMPPRRKARGDKAEGEDGQRRHGHRGHRHGFGGRKGRRDVSESGEAGLPGRRGRRTLEDVLENLTASGHLALDADGRYELTASGRERHDRLHTKVAELRARTGAGISEADYETTLRTLEKMARNLGWEK